MHILFCMQLEIVYDTIGYCIHNCHSSSEWRKKRLISTVDLLHLVTEQVLLFYKTLCHLTCL